MRTRIISFLLTIYSIAVGAQVVTTNPAFVTNDYGGEIEIIFDATKGNGGLKDYAGTDVYAHTGVITTASNGAWVHAPSWLDNSPKYKLSALGNNKWKLLITPSLAGYYNLSPGEIVTKLAFVFRNSTASVTGRDTGGGDIFANVYESGLNITFTSPSSHQTLAINSILNIAINASIPSDISLQINGSIVKSTNATTSLQHSQTFSEYGDYMMVASATTNGTTVYDTLYVCIPSPVVHETRPAGLINGINYNDEQSVTLILHAPNKTNVFVIGEFTNWLQKNVYQLKKDGEHWWITIDGLTPGKLYGFQYLVDNQIKISDPYTELVLDPWNDKWINERFNVFPDLTPYPEGKTDGLVSTFQTNKPDYNWEITDFQMPPKESLVIYELLLRDFTPEKTLEAAIGKLDYLKTLGVTAIELMPVHEFDGNNSWGYNPNHFFAPDKAYGTPEMYKKFVDECHKRGMAVILDVVFNHATSQSPFAKLFWNDTTGKPAANNPWMNVDAPHPYSVFHDFDHSYAETRAHFKRALQYWLTEYKIDGYRLDLTKGFTQKQSTEATASNYDQSRIDILTDYYEAAKATKSDVMFILEHFCNNDEEAVLANAGMYLWRNVNHSYSQAAKAVQSNSSFLSMITSPYKWVGYAESHDEERNFYLAKTEGIDAIKSDSLARISRIPLNFAFNLLLPGPKMIWQFGELGFDYSINSFGGRTNEKPSVWGWLDLPHRKAAYDDVSKIATLRKLYPNVFASGNFTLNISELDWTFGRRIALIDSELNLVVLGNFMATNSITAYPNFPKTGNWHNVLTGEIINVLETSMTLSIPAGKVMILADRVIDFPSGIAKKNTTTIEIYPTITNAGFSISTDENIQSVRIFNLEGKLTQTETERNNINIGHLPSGMYIVEIVTQQQTNYTKIIKY